MAREPLMDVPEERRRHFRLRYPEDARPAVLIDGVERALVEVSARGLRAIDPERSWDEGAVCDVALSFASHPTVTRQGAVVLRRDGDEVAIGFEREIDHALIMREQRRLIRRARRLNDPTALASLRTWPPR